MHAARSTNDGRIGESSLSGSCALAFNVTFDCSDDYTYQHHCVLDEPVRFCVSFLLRHLWRLLHCTFLQHEF